MDNGTPKILLIGYGNPGRLDDGLGPALAEAIEQLELPGVTVESNYQLTVEDAATVAAHDVVIFADAAVDGREPFAFQRINRQNGENNGVAATRFTSHHLAPADVVELAWRLFHREPECHTLAIRGYEFNDFGEGLSANARANLDRATEFLAAAIRLKLADGAGDAGELPRARLARGQVRLPRRRSPLDEPPDGGGPSGAFGTIEPDPFGKQRRERRYAGR